MGTILYVWQRPGGLPAEVTLLSGPVWSWQTPVVVIRTDSIFVAK